MTELIGPSPAAAVVRSRRLWAFAAAVLAVLVVAEAIALVLIVIPWNWELGQDYRFYRDVGARFLQDGSYYLPHQVEGPYVVRLMEDVLYPPHALLLFVPFAVLPFAVWWAVPIAATVYVLVWFRPAPWALCLMLVLLAWPRALGAYLFGNTDMWAAAGICAGLRWGWPAVLLTLKPTFAPFALIGMRNPLWWAATAILVLVSLSMFPLWLEYLATLQNMTISSDYSVGSLPLLLMPIVAWLSRPKVPDAAQ